MKDKFYDAYSDICDAIDKAIDSLGEKGALDALSEAIYNAQFDEYADKISFDYPDEYEGKDEDED